MAVDGDWKVYLAGEIHSDWRERIESGIRDAGLAVELMAPVTDHTASDDVGASILGDEAETFWRDHKGAGVNAVRTQTLLHKADIVVVRFGDQYRQWNAAFDAGYASALGKPIIGTCRVFSQRDLGRSHRRRRRLQAVRHPVRDGRSAA